MYYEKWGFMLIFWNLAGVPLSYCHCTLYLANHLDEVQSYPFRTPLLVLLFTSYLFMYWIWDTTNSQKNRFRAQERGTLVERKTFPQLPWQTVKNPRVIKTKSGDSILADGWYGKARKIHYTCDFYFALTWGLITGFNSPFPWFYPVFFGCMIVHRAYRDIQRCKIKYGESWTEYEKLVPYLFIPVSPHVPLTQSSLLTEAKVPFLRAAGTINTSGYTWRVQPPAPLPLSNLGFVTHYSCPLGGIENTGYQ